MIEVERMLNVLILRHEKGYNQFELAFLLGQRDLYIRDAEDPNKKLTYSVAATNQFRQIFGSGIQTIVPNVNQAPTYSTRILQATDEAGRNLYRADKKVGNGKWKSLISFGEEPKDLLLPSNSTITSEQIQSWVDEKYEGNYFYFPKTALKIFKDCEGHFNEPIRPIFLAEDLQSYTIKKKAPRLIKLRDKFNSWDVFAKETNDKTAFLKVKIERFVGSDDPGLVECVFTDTKGKQHIFQERWKAFTDIPIDAKSRLPVWGVVACLVTGRHKIKHPITGKEVKAAKISTQAHWGMNTIKGLNEFEVFDDMVMA
ncbi:hypothetical protein [Parapedobacter koreensis]|nr:hypothetical protein [Parapedobacter koreensis]